MLLLVDATNRLDILLPVACLFGFGDAIMNTQLYSILGFLFRTQAATAFAAFKLLQSMSTGILFFRTELREPPLSRTRPGPRNRRPTRAT